MSMYVPTAYRNVFTINFDTLTQSINILSNNNK